MFRGMRILKGFLIDTFELKISPLEYFPTCLCRGTIILYLQCFTPTHCVSGRGHAHLQT